jgi:uncharacterized protein
MEIKKHQIVILLIIIVLLSNCKSYIRSRIFPAPDDITIPKIGNDKLLEINNSNRVAKGLLIKNNEKIIVIFHGNGSTINNEIKAAKIFCNNNYSVLLVEYPGYGISNKYQVSEENIYSDSEILIKYLQEKLKYTNENIILYGRSLGAGVAVEMAKRKYGSKLVLLTPFTSIIDQVSGSLSKEFAEKNIDDKFDNLSKAKFIESPVLIVHGINDELVPYDMSVKLSREFRNSKIITIETKEHRYIYDVLNDKNWDDIINFINN